MSRTLRAFFRAGGGDPAALDTLYDELVRRSPAAIRWSRDPLPVVWGDQWATRLRAMPVDAVLYVPVVDRNGLGNGEHELSVFVGQSVVHPAQVFVLPLVVEDPPDDAVNSALLARPHHDLRGVWPSGLHAAPGQAVLEEISSWLWARVAGLAEDGDWDLRDTPPLPRSTPRPEPARVVVLPRPRPAPSRWLVDDDEVVLEEISEAPIPSMRRPTRTRRMWRGGAFVAVGALLCAVAGAAAAVQWRPASPPPVPVPVRAEAAPTCGNGAADPGEECDLASGNGTFAGGCNPECRLPWRGVPGGTVQLGSRPDERGRHDDEPWPRTVQVRPFEILATEVTVAQHRRFGETSEAETFPQANISWRQAAQYCEDVGGRLPTEAEWEAADRASSRSAWSCGDDPACLSARAWYGQTATQPVGGRDPNALGLYDLEGNVWEWVADCYHPSAHRVAEITRAEQVNVRGACNWRVVRGGSYRSPPELLRSAFRARRKPDDPQPTVGFRCVRGPATEPHPNTRA